MKSGIVFALGLSLLAATPACHFSYNYSSTSSETSISGSNGSYVSTTTTNGGLVQQVTAEMNGPFSVLEKDGHTVWKYHGHEISFDQATVLLDHKEVGKIPAHPTRTEITCRNDIFKMDVDGVNVCTLNLK